MNDECYMDTHILTPTRETHMTCGSHDLEINLIFNGETHMSFIR